MATEFHSKQMGCLPSKERRQRSLDCLPGGFCLVSLLSSEFRSPPPMSSLLLNRLFFHSSFFFSLLLFLLFLSSLTLFQLSVPQPNLHLLAHPRCNTLVPYLLFPYTHTSSHIKLHFNLDSLSSIHDELSGSSCVLLQPPQWVADSAHCCR